MRETSLQLDKGIAWLYEIYASFGDREYRLMVVL